MQHVWKVHLHTRFWSPEVKEIFKHDENQNTYCISVCTKWRKRRGSTFCVSTRNTIYRRTERRTDGRPRGCIDARSPFLTAVRTIKRNEIWWDLSNVYDEETYQNIVKLTRYMYTSKTFTYWSTVANQDNVHNKFLHMTSQNNYIYQYTFPRIVSLTLGNIGNSEITLKDMSKINLYKPQSWQSASRLHMFVGVCNHWHIWTELHFRSGRLADMSLHYLMVPSTLDM